MPASVTSQISSVSKICKDEQRFDSWAKEVYCASDDEIGVRAVPQQLSDLVSESKKLPKWLFDQDSKYYIQYKTLYPDLMVAFDQLPAYRKNQELPDTSNPEDLAEALYLILFISERHVFLKRNQHKSCNESDLRQPIDGLINQLWCRERGFSFGFLCRSECTLKLPKTINVPIRDCTADSVIFFCDPLNRPFEVFPLESQGGLTCTTFPPDSLEFVHWVTEYKLNDKAQVSRQVRYGMVSSLYQRRALGRMNDFVFGTAHSGNHLTVYAARWEEIQPKQEPIKPAALVNTEIPDAAHPGRTTKSGDDIRNESGSSMSATPRMTRSRSKISLVPETESTPSIVLSKISSPRPQFEIRIYPIAGYQTADPVAMAEYYLLMRASSSLASDYRQEIKNQTFSEIRERGEGLKLFQWPYPRTGAKTPPSKSRSRSELTSHPEEEEGPSDDIDLTDAADLNVEVAWIQEWREEAQRAIAQFDSDSFDKLEFMKPSYDERVSYHLNGVQSV